MVSIQLQKNASSAAIFQIAKSALTMYPQRKWLVTYAIQLQNLWAASVSAKRRLIS